MGWDRWIIDVAMVPLGATAMIGYHIWLFHRVRTRPLTTVIGVNHLNRKAWVNSIMRDVDKKNILAVQTLRNSIMASSLLATTAILLSSAIGAFVSSTSAATFKKSLNSLVLGATEAAWTTAKFFSILICFLFAFLCHVQAIRYTNHVNFLITIPIGPNAPGLTPDYVAKVLAHGSNFYTIGTRGYYFAFPLLLWLFGPIPMFIASMLMVPVLYHLDMAGDFSLTLHSAIQSVDASNQISTITNAGNMRHDQSMDMHRVDIID
eukprot:jgi/Mesen1/6710/ME000344S05994